MPIHNSTNDTPASELIFNLVPGDIVAIPGHELCFEAMLGDGLLHMKDARTGAPFQIRNLATGELMLPDTGWWMDVLRSGDYQISKRDDVRLPPKFPAYDHDEINKRDPKSELRRFVIDELRKRGANYSDPDVGRHLDAIWAEEKDKVEARGWKRPATGSARRWYRRLGEYATVRLVDAMSKSGRVGRTPSAKTMDAVLRGFVQAAALYYYTRDGYKSSDAVAYCRKLVDEENARREAEGGVLPALKTASASTVARAIKRIRCFDTLSEKKGKAWATRHYKVSGEGLYTQRALELVLADDKTWDTFAVIDAENRLPAGRPTLCVYMDVHTRCILGWRLFYQAPSLHTAVETLKHACRPKGATRLSQQGYPILQAIGGIFSTLITDNGKNYASAAFEDVLRDIGISLQLAAVKTPTHKAMLERFFRTLDTMLADKLPGYVYGSELEGELESVPSNRSILTKAELEELITEAIGVYHVTTHSALNMPPARAWEISVQKHSPGFLPNPRVLDHLLGSTKVLRLTTNGINLKGIWYRDPKETFKLLNDLSGVQMAKDRLKSRAAARVKVRYNEEDLTEIHVWNERTGQYVTIPAVNQRYVQGLSLFQHLQIKEWAQKEARAFNTEAQQLEARQALNDMIHRLAPKLEQRDRQAVARMMASERVNRYHALPAPPVIEVEATAHGNAQVAEVMPGVELREDRGAISARPPIAETKPAPVTPLDNSIETSTQGHDDPWDFDFEGGGDAA